MFGGELASPPKCCSKPRSLDKQDILAPAPGTPGHYAHFGRQPNSNQQVRMLHYQQKREAFDKLREENARTSVQKEALEVKFDQHAEKKRIQRNLEERVKEKWRRYEEAVEVRRRKLENLLCEEEKLYYYETVEIAQKGADLKMDEMKAKALMLKAKREDERLQIVHQKRIEQYKERCQDLRPSLEKKHLMESKYSQLQQMRENEARREADRELDRMWHELTLKELNAKKEREVQEMLERRDKEKQLLKVWNNQIRGKELMKEEMSRVAEEDRLEMSKLEEQLRKEEIKALDAKRRKRDKAAQEILEQISIQDKLQAQRKKEENALDQAFNTLAQLEIEREKAITQDASSQAKRETAMYRKHLQQLDEQRKLEEKKLAELLEIHRKEVEAKQDEARCKIVLAKRKLQQKVLAERAEQVKYKKEEAEQQLKLKEAENELLRMAFDTNERLQAESDRLERQAALQYREDLHKQIEYNNTIRQREREELERQLRQGMEEEEKYRKIVEQMLKGEIQGDGKHPFRKVLEQYDCRCPDFKKN